MHIIVVIEVRGEQNVDQSMHIATSEKRIIYYNSNEIGWKNVLMTSGGARDYRKCIWVFICGSRR